MPWEKQFDEDEALDAAMRVFWRRGYRATSVQDLVDAMGVQRGSLYAAFGDKRALFLKALHRYDRLHRRAFIAEMRASGSGKPAIRRAFEDVAQTALRDGPRDGCFLVNTALEMSPHDPEVAGVVSEGLGGVEAFFADAVRAGRASGDIPSSVPVTDTARSLLGLFIGLRVLSRSRAERPLFRSIVRQAEALVS